ncbi:MAG: DUF11 domain-containing protein, partial [Burkholderiaceae bacterium]|nr:DUF11 domain-containing protein [Burkholderiaceae bacterium]
VLPNGTTQTVVIGSLANGSSTVTVVNYSVPAGSITTQNWTAGVATTTPESNLANNTATSAQAIVLIADLVTTITVSPEGTPGATITATVTWVNNGPSAADGVVGSIILPDGTVQNVNIGALGVGSIVQSTATYRVPNNAIGESTLTWTAGISGATTETNLSNNTVTAPTIVVTMADVSTTLVVPQSGTPGTTISVTVTWVNNGPSTAQNVTGTVVLPSGVTQTFGLGAMPVGSSTFKVVSYLVPAGSNAGESMTWIAGVATTTLESTLANNTVSASTGVAAVFNASLSGRVWLDRNSDRWWQGNLDTPLNGYRVDVLKGSLVVGSATTAADGRYRVDGLPTGTGYSVRFTDSSGNVIYGVPFNQRNLTERGNVQTGGTLLTSPTQSNIPVTVSGAISGVTLYAGDNVVEQNLPLDPSGVVYDSVTRKPIAGARVTLEGPPGFNPSTHLVGGVNSMVTADDGLYQFLFINSPPNGNYRLRVVAPNGYLPTPAVLGGVALPQGLLNVPSGVNYIQPQADAPGVELTGLPGTLYYLDMQWDFGQFREVRHNHIPLDPLSSGALLINKVGNKTVAEIGDSVEYTIRVKNTTAQSIPGVRVEDLLPAGFRYIPGTTRVAGVSVADPSGGIGRQMVFSIGNVSGDATVELKYIVRVGVGSQEGDGINRATAVFNGVNGPVRSNTAIFKVTVQGGVFSNEGCIVGKVYVDCDGNHVQNNNSGSRDLGVPGVRIVMLDGSYVITDSEGKYSLCGVKPQTHVIKVDKTTLPRGARLVPSSNRNAGSGDSIFVDMRAGEMARADFIEGSCSVEVLDQVKARRTEGRIIVPAKESSGERPAEGAKR